MSMKRLLRLVAALSLACAIALSCAVTSSATVFAPGEPAALVSDPLASSEPYSVEVKQINSLVLRLFGKTLFNPARNSTPFRSVTIDESAEDVVTLTGGEKTLKHLQIDVNEDAKTIVVTMPDHLLWCYAGSSVDIVIGVPVKSLTIAQSDKVSIDYQDATVTEFALKTDGPMASNCSFGQLSKLTAEVYNHGQAVFSGEGAQEVVYQLTGLSKVLAFGLPADKATITVSGSSIAKQFFTEGAQLIGRINSVSEIWYDYDYYDIDNDPAQTELLEGPDVTNVIVSTGARLVKLRKIV